MGDAAVVLRQRVLDWLTENVPTPRVEPSLRVEQMATKLAEQHGLEAAKAAQAGLMHGLAEYLQPSALLQTAAQAGFNLDSIYEVNPHLLHAEVSAVVARQRFGVTHPQVLAAIANCPLGQPEMDGLSCVICLTAHPEPGQRDHSDLQNLRQIGKQDLIQAIWRISDDTLQQLRAARCLIHPHALAPRNWFLRQTRFPQQSRVRPLAAASSLLVLLIERRSTIQSKSTLAYRFTVVLNY